MRLAAAANPSNRSAQTDADIRIMLSPGGMLHACMMVNTNQLKADNFSAPENFPASFACLNFLPSALYRVCSLCALDVPFTLAK